MKRFYIFALFFLISFDAYAVPHQYEKTSRVGTNDQVIQNLGCQEPPPSVSCTGQEQPAKQWWFDIGNYPSHLTVDDFDLNVIVNSSSDVYCDVRVGLAGSSTKLYMFESITEGAVCELAKCQADTMNYLSVSIQAGTLPLDRKVGTNGAPSSGYTCFHDTAGDLCGFNVPANKFMVRAGRNNTDNIPSSFIYPLFPDSRNLNANRKLFGTQSNQECSQEFINNHPAANLPSSPQSLNQSGQTVPNVEVTNNGKKVTYQMQMQDGTVKTFKLNVPVVADAVAGGCEGSGLCMSMIETEEGKDRISIVRDIDPPDPAVIFATPDLPAVTTVYESTLEFVNENGEVHAIDVFSSPELTDQTTQVNDNAPDTRSNPTNFPSTHTQTVSQVVGLTGNTADDGSGVFNTTTVTLGDFDGDGTIDTGTGTGTGGDDGTGTGTGTGGDDGTGTGTGETPEIVINCGGSSGISCETTQLRIDENIAKIEDVLSKDKPSIESGNFTDSSNATAVEVAQLKLELKDSMLIARTELLSIISPLNNRTGVLMSPVLPTPFGDFPLQLSNHSDILNMIASVILAISYFTAFWIMLERK